MALMTWEQVKAIPTGVDISGYSQEQLEFWIEVAEQMISDYTGRDFSSGNKTDKGETVVDRTGRVIIRTL